MARKSSTGFSLCRAIVDNYYHDVAVLAIREKATRPVAPATVTASSTLEGYVGEWNFHPQDAVDGDPETYWSSAKTALSPNDPTWLAFDYDDPFARQRNLCAAGSRERTARVRTSVLAGRPDLHLRVPVQHGERQRQSAWISRRCGAGISGSR